jgi:type I restriction enzyme R subunit
MAFNENSRVKIPAILHLCRLGYEYLSLKGAKWDISTNIFVDVFKESVKKLNPELSFAQQRMNQITAQLVIVAKEQSKPKVEKLEEIAGDPTKESITENAALLDAANKKRIAELIAKVKFGG